MAFALISLFHVQIEEPASKSTTTTAFDHDWWSWWWLWTEALRPFYNWRYKDLPMPRDQKVMTLLAPMEKCPMDFYQEVVFAAQIWSQWPLWLEIKRFFKVTRTWGNDISTFWDGVPNRTLWMRFTSCPDLIFLASPCLNIYRFPN